MMKNQNRKIPKIRFNNSKIDWQQVKFKNLLNLEEGIRRGPFGSALKKEFFVQNSEYVVYEQQNAIYDHFNTRYRISEEKYHELNKFMLSSGDFIMSGAGTIGKISLVPDGIEKGVFNQALIRLRVNKNINKEFFLQWMRSPEMQNKLTKANPASAMVNLVPMSEVKEWDVIVPSFEEQSAIGSLFRTLDNLLSNYKDNLANYQSLKATMLSKMFPKAGQTVPEIRLNGFEGEWVEKRLKDISKRVTRKNNDLVSERALTISAQFGLIDQEEFFQKKIASKDVSGYYLIKKGEFAYNKSYSTGYPLGAIKRLDKYENGVLSTLYILFKAVDVDSDYLAHYYESDKWHREVSMCAAEGARNHGLLNIAPADFFNTRLVIPKELAEQQAIGLYFSNLDNLVNSHQEKISQLETLKKKLLQDMFI